MPSTRSNSPSPSVIVISDTEDDVVEAPAPPRISRRARVSVDAQCLSVISRARDFIAKTRHVMAKHKFAQRGSRRIAQYRADIANLKNEIALSDVMSVRAKKRVKISSLEFDLRYEETFFASLGDTEAQVKEVTAVSFEPTSKYYKNTAATNAGRLIIAQNIHFQLRRVLAQNSRSPCPLYRGRRRCDPLKFYSRPSPSARSV